MRRSVPGDQIEDSIAIDNVEYNSKAGAQKNIEVGPALEYVGVLTSEITISPSDQLYIFKTTSGIGYVTMSATSGATPGAAPGQDIFPVFGEIFTRYSAADYKYIVGAANMHLYRLKDNSRERKNP